MAIINDRLRPGSIAVANDKAQVGEFEVQGELIRTSSTSSRAPRPS